MYTATMKKIVLIAVYMFIGIATAFADNARITVEAPSAVEAGDQFRVQFTVNTDDVSNFEAPDFKGFEVIFGPSTMRQSGVQIINGRASRNSSITYTFVILGSKPGTYKLGSATAVVDGKTIRSNSVQIKVLPMGQGGASSSQSGSSRRRSQSGNSNPSASDISRDELFITAEASRTRVHEQEAILLTYKLYTLVNLTQLDGKLPSLNGFQIQELPLPRNKKYSLESYNGRNYQTVVWSQYLLFPQQSGDLVIPALTFEGIVQEINRNIDPIDAFFNGTSGLIELKKKIVAPKIVIHVSSLPAKPDNFSGAVGHFSVSSSISGDKFKTNDAVTFKVDVSGTGNMKLISTPKVNFPKDFEVYDPKINDNFSITRNGLTGTRQFEYLVVPRRPGTYTIPAIDFVYFDTSADVYKTVSTKPYAITVEKGKGNASQAIADFTGGQEDVKTLNEDIRYIKTGDVKLSKNGAPFFGTWMYVLVYVVLLIVFVVILVLGRKQMRDNANIAKMRGKKANKVAGKRMKYASQLLSAKKQGEFYDEVLRTLWGYISDKLNIPQEHLNKDNVAMRLDEHGVDKALTEEFIKVLNDCEFARYAPGDAIETMDKTYEDAVAIISKMENNIKK